MPHVDVPVRLVIFDCDGVLVDSERLALKTDMRMLAQLGWPITERELIDRFLGVSDAAFHRAIESRLARSLPADWRRKWQQAHRTTFAAHLRPVRGIVAALDKIQVPMCVASSGTHDKIRFMLGLTGLYSRFEGRVFSATEVVRGKPAPDLFLHAAELMQVDPAHCVVVEDSAHGVAAARAAGMRVLAYAGGLIAARRLVGPNTVVFRRMRYLPTLVHRLDHPSLWQRVLRDSGARIRSRIGRLWH